MVGKTAHTSSEETRKNIPPQKKEKRNRLHSTSQFLQSTPKHLPEMLHSFILFPRPLQATSSVMGFELLDPTLLTQEDTALLDFPPPFVAWAFADDAVALPDAAEPALFVVPFPEVESDPVAVFPPFPPTVNFWQSS